MITPLDIENKKFNKQMMNGYNVDEVDEFLDQIMQDYETNYKELATLTAKVDELNNALNHYKRLSSLPIIRRCTKISKITMKKQICP